jgi:solute carrier family 25 (mitochondrial aspartate/glutamate transporter), member 12/13
MDNLTSGSIAGGIGAFCVLPIDITKTRVQSSISKPKPFEIIKHIYKTNGIKGFYAGGISQILFVSPEKAIKFTTNDFVLNMTDNKIIAGMSAGLSQIIITNPMEILKIQSQMHIKNNFGQKKLSIINAYKQIGGFFGLYKGLGFCALRDIPFSGIYFPLYHILSNDICNTYLSSLISGSIAAFSCTPMDIIKTRIQYKLNVSYKEIIKELIKNEGLAGFFKGSLWRALKSGPQFMITQTVYNFFNKSI